MSRSTPGRSPGRPGPPSRCARGRLRPECLHAPASGPHSRASPWPAWARCCRLVGFWLAWGPGGRSLGGLVDDNVLNNAANGVTLAVLAAILLWLRPDNRLGWLVLLIALANSITMFGTGWVMASYHVSLPARAWFAWWGSWPWAPAFLLGSSLVLLLYPSGRTVSRFGHRLAVASVWASAGLVLGSRAAGRAVRRGSRRATAWGTTRSAVAIYRDRCSRSRSPPSSRGSPSPS